jgi:signal transduction histidine kinase
LTIGSSLIDTGMELHDLLRDEEFAQRTRTARRFESNLQAMKRLAHVFVEKPAVVLQELVDVAVECCGADSAGISLEDANERGERVFRWVAISGSFAQYVNGTTPRFFSPCGRCLDSRRAQHYRVTQPYYEFLGVSADDITDGLLIPWINEHLRGTLWAVSHHSRTAFDMEDYRLLATLADFASMGLRHRHQEQLLRTHEKEVALAAKVNELAHQMNNPLQSLTNTLYLAQKGGDDSAQRLEQAMAELAKLSGTVSQFLSRNTA